MPVELTAYATRQPQWTRAMSDAIDATLRRRSIRSYLPAGVSGEQSDTLL